MQPDDLETTGSTSRVAVLDNPAATTSEIAEAQAPIAHDPVSPLFSTPKRTGVSLWVWVGLLLSLGLHISLIVIPTENEPKAPPPVPQEKEKQVRITQLAKLKTVKLPRRVVKPAVKPVVRQRTAPVIPPPPKPPAPNPDLQSSISKPASEGATESSSWEDFPIYPGSQPGCFGLPSCLQTNDPLQQVADYYSKELPAKKYAIKPTIREATRQVFQVSRKGEGQFLSIIQTENGQAIVLSDAPRSLDDLRKAVEVPPEVAAILSSLAAENAKPDDFVQPDLAYAKSTEKGYASGAFIPKPEVVNISLVRSYSFDTMMNEFFRSNLQNAGFEVIDLPQDFGGGKLYQVNKDSTKLYLSLLPTKSGEDTLIVTWKNQPK